MQNFCEIHNLKNPKYGNSQCENFQSIKLSEWNIYIYRLLYTPYESKIGFLSCAHSVP